MPAVGRVLPEAFSCVRSHPHHDLTGQVESGLPSDYGGNWVLEFEGSAQGPRASKRLCQDLSLGLSDVETTRPSPPSLLVQGVLAGG